MPGTTGGTGSAATDETDQLISSTKVEGTAVYNRQGERLGTVASFMVDKRTGQVAYVVLSTGGFLGLGQAYHPVPWSLLSYDEERGGYVVQITTSMLSGGPSYRPDTAPNFDDQYGRRIDDYYRLPPGTMSL